MDKLKLNYIVDIGLIIAIVVSFITGIVRYSELYAFLGINYGQVLRLLPTYEIRIIHDWMGVIFGILVLIHLILNWKWLVSMTKRYFGRG